MLVLLLFILQIREKDYRKTILTSSLEIHIISLPKLMKMLENKEIPKQDEKLAIWSKFILNPEMLEESEMQRNKVVKKAKEEFGNMTRSKYEQRLAELREKAIMDEKSHRSSWYEDGYEEGREEGRLEIVEKVIRNELTIEDMAQITGKTVEEIIEITGLTKEEIEKI